MKILVGIDGSSAAQAALDLVARLAWPDDTHLRIVEVVETEPDLFRTWPAMAYSRADDLEKEFVHSAVVSLEAARRRLRDTGLAIDTEILRGRPAEAILADARREGADLIVVGSRGHGTLEAMLLGSVSAEIVSRSTVPVLVVRSATADRAVLAWDGLPAAQAALQLIETWPLFRHANVRVASVVDAGPWWATMPPVVPAETTLLFEEASIEARQLAESGVATAASRLRAAGLAADEAVLEGDPAPELITCARRWNADLVVTGTHGRHGLAGLVLGSVARTLVLHSPTSVLVVPTPASASRGDGDTRPTSAARPADGPDGPRQPGPPARVR
ncbi:MAG TPA: universal stress protein [Candidatus Limnocylindrales bacterium]|nr:universal stress protein [Candidatus Limnocylindrales bacterium]